MLDLVLPARVKQGYRQCRYPCIVLGAPPQHPESTTMPHIDPYNNRQMQSFARNIAPYLGDHVYSAQR